MKYSIILTLFGQSKAQIDAYYGIGILELETPFYNGYGGFRGDLR